MMMTTMKSCMSCAVENDEAKCLSRTRLGMCLHKMGIFLVAVQFLAKRCPLGVQAFCFSSILRFTLLQLTLSSEVSSARSLAAYFGMLKVSHMLITGSFIQRLLFPKRIAGVVAVCCCMFVLFLAIFSSRIQTRLNAPTGDFVVFSAAMYAIAAALAISVHCIDACCDCLLQERKARAQTTRKLVSIVGSCVAVALLILPDRYFLIPVIVFACLTAILGALLSLLWWFLPENAEVTFQKMKFRSSAVLPARFIGVIIFAAVIGDNADQVLDAVANVQIDSFVSGGKVKAAIAKEVTSMLASSVSAYIYMQDKVPQTGKLFNSFAFKVCMLWSVLQCFRLLIYCISMSDTFSDDIGVLIIFFITLSEKIAGSAFECSRSQVEAEWLFSVSVCAARDQLVHMVFSPVFWMSVSEVLGNFSGNLIKLVFGTGTINCTIFITASAVIFFVCCANGLQIFMIQDVQQKKHD